MSTLRRTILIGGALPVAAVAAVVTTLQAQDIKISDPRSVVMIVNRDSNDISFMDIKTHKMVGKTFLGNNVNDFDTFAVGLGFAF